MAQQWNGDGAVVASKKPALYVVPSEGAELWIDAYCVPKGCEQSRRGSRVDRVRLRPEEQRAGDRIHVLRLAPQAQHAEGACSRRRSSTIPPSSRRRGRSRISRPKPRHGEGDAAPRADLDGVQVRLTLTAEENADEPARAAGPRRRPAITRLALGAGGLVVPAVLPRGRSDHGGGTRSPKSSASPASRSTGTSTTTAFSGTRSTARSSGARCGSRSSAQRSVSRSGSRLRTTSRAMRSGRRSCSCS